MDRYSYNPNSRIARRIKERERKKRRNRRIRRTILAILIVCAAGYGGYSFFGNSITLPEFDPQAGFARLTAAVSGRNTDKEANKSDSEVLAEPTSTPEDIPEGSVEEASAGEPMESDFWDNAEQVSSAGVYPAPSENNNLLEIFKTAAGETEKICCLTFDDGPNSATTPQILDTLAKYNIKATFFELGDKLAANKDIAKRAYDEGHLLANHTYTQKYSTIYTNWDSFWGEIQKTEALITEITGEPAYKLVRFPGGSFNTGVYAGVKQEYRAKLAENGYYFVDWSVDNGDDGTRNAAQILEYVKDYTGSKPIILLMEDSNIRRATVQSLSSVIEYLQSRGYVFKRLDEICYYTAEEMPTAAPAANANGYNIFVSRGFII